MRAPQCDTVWAQHLELEVGVGRDRHEPGIAREPKDSVVRSTESDHFKSESLLSEVGRCAKADRQIDPTDGFCPFPWYNTVKTPDAGLEARSLDPRRLRVWV
jgi:hypothetical protein